MAETTEKKFLTLPRLQEYDALLKQKTENDDANILKEAKSYSDSIVNGLATSSSVDNKISSHNTLASAHNDIRLLISDLSTKLNNFLDVDDTTTDQLSEVLQLINNNKGTLESLTTTKINVSDIVNDLTTASASKVLSANQGAILKGLIDTLQEELDSHTHEISEITGLKDSLDNKADKSHGTHVSYDTSAPIMDGIANAGSSNTVARSDHAHPTDTSRAAKEDLDSHVSNKSNPHGVNLTQLGVNATENELNCNIGILSNVQEQLNNKSVVKIVRWS